MIKKVGLGFTHKNGCRIDVLWRPVLVYDLPFSSQYPVGHHDKSLENDVNDKEERPERCRGAYIGNRVSKRVQIDQKVLFQEEKEWFNSLMEKIKNKHHSPLVQFQNGIPKYFFSSSTGSIPE